MNDGLPYSLPIIDAIRHDYERFRFDTHQHSHKGLFTDGKEVFAVVLDVKNNEELLNELTEQYHRFHTLGIPPALIVGEVLDTYRALESRSKFEKTQIHGQPMTMDETINQLVLHIPRKYHPFHVDFLWATNEFKLTLKIAIPKNEQQDIQLICESVGYQGYDYIFEVDSTIPDFPGEVEYKSNTHNNMQLTASGLIQKQFPRQLLARYEEDEDFWIQNRHSVFSGDKTEQRDRFLLPNFETKQTRCFVDASVFPRQNIRIYLTLYEQVVIALPLNNEAEYFYRMFKFNKYELKELVARGRLLFVAPQNLTRYSQELLLDIISVNPNAIVFSRRLAAATIQGIQKKSGIVGTTFSSDEQYHFLHHCSRIDNPDVQRFALMLSEQWQFGEFLVNKEGATSAHRLGISNLAVKSFQDKGRDLLIELTTAGSSYEYAQGLGAHHFPFDDDNYSEAVACQIVSGLYNGVTNSRQVRESELQVLLSEIFAVNNDMDVIELDSALSSSLIRSLPSIIKEYANMDEGEYFNKLRALKQELKTIESNKARLSKLNISGFAPTLIGAGMEFANIKGGGLVALGGWLLNAIKVYASDSELKNNPIFTRLSSFNHFTSHDAIIVQRVRDSLSR
ncbi:hypothetical protein [Vibrio coralliilyticus]|uniref:hypothetical protein n=1 Tax=Vibrio coralliilyticus TaxID=190893 RepID=UPI00155F7880|nr:hypothetical protein [Vibrio coralliilyticus]NRF28640.1 hypothetical protein [Vibrio coralliilyticus]NRF51549.1 hypothetical protein [Vibrio coralliilyticus]